MLLIFVIKYAFTQYRNDKFLVGANFGIAYPFGDLSKISKLGYDARFDFKTFINKRIAVGFETGYQRLGGDDEFWDGSKFGEYNVKFEILPVLFSGSYFFETLDRDFKPYISLAFGYFFFKNRVDFDSANTNPYPSNSAYPSQLYKIKHNKFGVNPSLGFIYMINKRFCFHTNLKLNYIAGFPETTSVKIERTNVIDKSYKYYTVDDYKTGFEIYQSLSFNIGFYYRLNRLF